MKHSQTTKINLYVINYVRDLRIKHGVTQVELAFRLKVSEGFIGKIESPKYTTKYNLNHLNELAKIFNCSPKDFLPESWIEENN